MSMVEKVRAIQHAFERGWDHTEAEAIAAALAEAEKESRAVAHLANKVNAVTAPHRHGKPVSKRRLDDLANAQIDFEHGDAAFQRAREAFFVDGDDDWLDEYCPHELKKILREFFGGGEK